MARVKYNGSSEAENVFFALTARYSYRLDHITATFDPLKTTTPFFFFFGLVLFLFISV